ncbi:Purine nucleoside phosphorylase [Candida viswanathii]|uniref:Purine nucleoside phosphorylase n=1 Tax=Candida viswanathii TaxID=5486 RepID=A0A367YJ96_9ASCO|nr:Purine nucleoside phosphorylase [Candida viswanathii]
MAETIPPEEYLRQINHATDIIKHNISKHPELSEPRVMIICGSGLGGIADILEPTTKLEISYSAIPGFKTSTVPGHAGKLVFGLIGTNKVPVMCMVGRLHFYEGYTFQETTFPVRIAKLLGITSVIVTNAAGGVNPEYKPGDLMVIEDHINFPGLAGYHPLRGPNLSEFGPRFQPLSDAYDYGLRKLFLTTARDKLGITRKIYEGTYFFAAGPTFESRAEVRMIRVLGGDAVGMSTVPEVIVARHSGLKVLALSLITNAGVGAKPPSAFDENPKALDEGMASHDEVLQAADEASKDVEKIVESVVNQL